MKQLNSQWTCTNKLAICLCYIFLGQVAQAELNTEAIREAFASPGVDSQPRTRWWWMGNPITKDEITWQLEQMRSKGIVGVEQISMSRVYEKGNVEYLSEPFLELLRHAVSESRRLGMKFSLNFGGPGWVIGGAWVPQEDRSRCMVPTHLDLVGSRLYEGPLPTSFSDEVGRLEVAAHPIDSDEVPLAVVAARLDGTTLDPDSLIDLTGLVGEDRRLSWRVPPGEWRLTCFWLRFTRHGHDVDHFNKAAMERYCETFGSVLVENFGENLGESFESMFCDSFEVAMLPNSIYWSEGLLELFQERKGYDLTRFLPAIWFDVGELSPKIRYDVNEFLHEVGLEAFFEPFLDWCSRHGVQGRIQPYGFSTDNIEAAGTTHIPEMEITAGEKDAVPWFDTRIGPKKYVASGAHLYGRNIVSVEAHTYLHWEPYRATLEELKIVSDVFLRYGANLFFNIGYTATPERAPAPSRTFYSAVRISHQNVWWEHYPLLGDYVARCCNLLQKGDFTADIAVYSPLANQWTLDVRNPRKWTRAFQWGALGGLLIANGYDFDLLNDDILQNRAEIADRSIRVRNLRYRILILPNVEAMPLETLEFVRDFVEAGGVVIALERVPDSSVGYKDHREKDEAVRAIADRLFGIPEGWNGITGRRGRAPVDFGQGRTYTLTRVLDRSNPLDLYSSTLDPFLRILRRHCIPDFGIDFANLDSRRNEGLTFIHRKLDDTDIYFVTNVQGKPVRLPISFRVTGKVPWCWNPYDGKVSRVWQYRMGESVTEVPMVLGPYESTFIVFEPGDGSPHVTETDLDCIVKLDPDGTLEALAVENGQYTLRAKTDGNTVQENITVQGVPAPFQIRGRWDLELSEDGEVVHREEYASLRSWTDSEETKHFSGTGTYRINFDLPAEYIRDDIVLRLSPGRVGNLANLVLNGEDLGTCWIRGQSLDATGVLRRSNNELVVKVVNTLINRVAGWDELPPVPERLFPRLGNGVNDKSSHYKILLDFEPLPPSGLLGPVRILPSKKIRLNLNESG